MRIIITSRPISESEFLPFGRLIESPKTGVREDFVASIFNGRNSAKANLALIRQQATEHRFTATTLERHTHSTQSFFPLGVARYLVVVCGSDANGDPNLNTLRAFECRGDQAMSYDEGTWHLGLKALDAPGVFAVLVHEDGSADDCEFREVSPFEVRVGAI